MVRSSLLALLAKNVRSSLLALLAKNVPVPIFVLVLVFVVAAGYVS